MGDRPSSFSNPEYYKTRPVERTSYNSIRGATNSVPAINWPGTGSLVLSTSFMGILRAKTGFLDFDLPTDAQWEYACRAGTATVFNDGDASANTSGANATTNTWLNALGRYKFNGGYTDDGIRPDTDSGPENGTAIVGSYLPNAWGLYDMHGNVMELCLDWHERSYEGGEDPIGLESGSHRVRRGGSWNYDAAASIAGSRHAEPPHVGYNYFGFRIVRTLP